MTVRRIRVEHEPAEVGVDRRRARDDPEPLLPQPRHGEVGDDPSVAVQELRVDHAPHRAVDAGVAHPLEQRQRARARDRDLAEGRQVHDADAVADRVMLAREPIEVGRRLPSERALVLSRAAPRAARLEVVRALPAVLRAEDGAELLEAPVERTQPPPASRLARVERVAQPVVVPVDLTSGRLGVGGGMILRRRPMLIEKRRPHGGSVRGDGRDRSSDRGGVRVSGER